MSPDQLYELGEKKVEKLVETFEKELAGLLNKHNKDTQTDTPDFILAEMLNLQLKAYNQCRLKTLNLRGRERFQPTIGVETTPPSEAIN